MLRQVSLIACATAAFGCGDREVALGFPPEILDGSFRSAVWLLQSGEATSAPVHHAELVELPPVDRWRLEFEEGDRIRVIAYETHPESLPSEFGPLPAASPGQGLALPDGARAFLSTALTAGDPGWHASSPTALSAIPWRIPAPVSDGVCPGAKTETWRLDALARVRPRVLLAERLSQVVVAGHLSEPDGVSAQETVLAIVHNIDSVPIVEPLATPIAGQSYRGAIWIEARVLLASGTTAG